MDVLSGIMLGFQTCLSFTNVFYCFVGVFIGTLVGVLPGIGSAGTIAMLLPITIGLPPVTATIMLAGIYYGAMYGGSTTSILVNIPGEAASVVTCLDGHQMARHGRAGAALGISAFGSFIAGTVCVLGLIYLVFPLSNAALAFGPPEYFSIVLASMILLSYLARGSMIKALIMMLFGLALSTQGTDLVSGTRRFTFGSSTLLEGIGLIPLAMGFFGVAEVFVNLETSMERSILKEKIKNILPNWSDWKRSIAPIGRGTVIGFFLGIIPGSGPVLSTFFSYAVEKRLSKHPEEFGRGAIEGLAGPETANNAASEGAFVPMLSLGIPSNPMIALLLGGLMMHGLVPGPLLITQHPDLFWGIICSMYIGNVMLLLLNLPLIPLWVRVLKIPYRILMPLILLFCLMGVYSTNYNLWDVVVMTIMGVVGFFLRKYNYELAPVILAFVLGPLLEGNFRQSLIISDGSFSIFLARPISAVAIGVAALLLISTGFSAYRKTKKRIDEMGED